MPPSEKQGSGMAPNESTGNFFPPGLSVRHVGPTDNEGVRRLFISTQAELVPEDADLETRIAMKKYTDAGLMDDLARVSTYYREAGRRMWVLESQQHEIVAFAAVDSDEEFASVAVLRRIAVSPEFRRKGVAALLTGRALQWATKQGFTKIRLHVSEYQTAARELFTKLEFTDVDSGNYGPVAVTEMQKSLKANASKKAS